MRSLGMKSGIWCGVLAALGLGISAYAANPSGDLRIEIIAAYNLVVDSNVESPSTYAPRSAYLGAKFYNDGTNDLTGVTAYIGDYVAGAGTPGLYPTNYHPAYPLRAGPTNGAFSLTHEGGSAGLSDATRYIGTIKAGESVTMYWLVSYPNVDTNGLAVWGPSIKPDDDLKLYYDVWATATRAGSSIVADATRDVTMRNEISAMANKIFPNTANKVPEEYQQLLDKYVPAWTNIATDGSAGTLITTEGVWYDLGNVGEGFDNDGDLVPDHNLWMQPVGDPALFDAGAFRLVRTYAMVVVKLKTGGEYVYVTEDQLYFQNVPENNGAVGYVAYQFMALGGAGSSTLSPYQEVASGRDNEKFNGDYGATIGGGLVSPQPNVDMFKDGTPEVVEAGSNISYAITFTNSGALPIGNPSLNVPLVVQDRIPSGTVYVAGSATNNNTLPSGVASYLVFYSTNNGTSWQTTEPVPATKVTHLQWWLSDVFQTNTYGTVRFSATVTNGYTGSPFIYNVAGLSIGSGAPFLTDDATSRVSGTNRLGDMVFRDNGAGLNYGNGTQDSDEPGISNIAVRLYYDANTNGTYEVTDPFFTSTTTATNGYYLFTNLFAGRYVAVVDVTDTDLPAGYTITTPSSYGALLGPGGTNAFLTADFGFAPALRLTKSLLSPTNNLLYEGRTVSYALDVQNMLPGDGLGGGLPVSYTVWATNGTASDAEWHGYVNIFTPPGTNGVYATNHFENASKAVVLSGFPVGVQPGSVSNVSVLLPIGMVQPVDTDDTLMVDVKSLSPAATIFSRTYYATGLVSGTMVIPITNAYAWTWQNFATNYTITLTADKGGGKSGAGYILVDAVGFRIASSATVGGGNANTTLKPVPLTDTYDTNQLQFVSASPPYTTHTFSGSTGTLYWSDLGPIYPGGSNRVTLTFNVLQPLSNMVSEVTNTASVTAARFLNGLPANADTSRVTTTVRPTGMIGDFIWRDLDGDGVQDGGTETGISGVRVVLTPPGNADAGSGLGVPVTNVTDSTGYYLFTGIYGTNAGSYTITVLTNTLPGALPRNTYDLDNGTNAPDSLVTLTNFNPAAVNGGDINTNVDFGYQVQSRIVGTIWNDVNRNGTNYAESGEGWLTNVTVYLYSTTNLNSAIATNRTDANGYFSFVGNYTGAYAVVAVTNTGAMTNSTWIQTFDTDFSTAGLSNRVDVTVVGGGEARADFSYYQYGTYGIGDQLFYDWNSNGVYSAATEEGVRYITVSLYEDANSNGVVDAGIDAIVAVTNTDINGIYNFTNLPPGSYQVIVDQADPQMPPLYLVTADPYLAKDGKSVVTITNASRTDQDFGYWPYGTGSIGDTVWLDANADGVQLGVTERGISNITVSLYVDMNGDSNYVLRATAVTDVNGYYLFPSLPDGAYKVVVDPADADLPMDVFGYRVMPTTATNYLVTVATNSTLTADFGFAALAAVGDTIFWDVNSSGSQDGSESGISNVLVELYRDLNSNGVYDVGETKVTETNTASNGTYLFAGLQPGLYVVMVNTGSVALTGATLTADPDNDGLPCGAPGATNCDHQVGVTLQAGGNFMGADFGYRPKGVLGDTLWFDMNTNGVRDAGEYGIPYVTVGLYTNGTLVATNVTDADGYYGFGNLADATYTVRVFTNDTDFPAGVTNVYAPDGTLDHEATAVVLSNGVVTTVNGATWTNGNLSIDFGYRYAGNNFLSGTIGMDAEPYDGVMGTNTTGVGPGEAPFTGLTVYAYLWQDLDTDGVVDPAERTLIGSTETDNSGDYLFTGLPNAIGTVTNRYLVSTAPPLGVEVRLTTSTTNGLTPALTVVNTTNTQGITLSAYQILAIQPAVTNVDFAFAPARRFDYGDLPSSYGTLLTDPTAGARHTVKTVPDLYLGSAPDTEFNGQPTADASGDDTNGVPDDEDGVIAVGNWTTATNGGQVSVTVGAGSGWLCGYMDFNHDGNFADSNELFISQAVSPGTYAIPFAVPEGAILTSNATQLYARFRLFPSEPLIPEVAYSGLANNGEVEDYRFDFGTIGDTIWVDTDGDGTRDAGEPPIANVTVYIDADGDGIRDAGEPYGVTDMTGFYGIGGLTGGVYTVRVETNGIPAGLLLSYDPDGARDGTAVVTLGSGAYVNTVDFGYRLPGAVGDRVWLDENADGVQDAGEAGIANVRVVLYGTNGVAIATNLTDSGGQYLFTGLYPDAYEVRVDTNSLPAGLAANQTFDPDATTNHQTTVVVLSGGEIRTADFGYDWSPSSDVFGNAGTGAIGDRVWVDANGDGVQDPGEPGLGGVTLRLVGLGADGIAGTADDTTNTTVTAADGGYYFDSLAAGAYLVSVTAGTSGYTQTGDPDGIQDGRTTTPILLAPGDVYVNADFGYQPAAGSQLSGTVYFDANVNSNLNAGENGIVGVSVALVDSNGVVIATTLTDTNGYYQFTGLQAGDYTVWVNDTGYRLGGLMQTEDPDATVNARTPVSVDGASAYSGYDFGYIAGSYRPGTGLIGDTIYFDRNTNSTFESGEGIEGVRVGLYTTNGVLLGLATTDANGQYWFGGLRTNDAVYVVRIDTNSLPYGGMGLTNSVDPDGATAHESTLTLTGAQPVRLDQDFGYRAVTPNTISGTIWNDRNADGILTNESGVYAGVTVSLYDTNGNLVATTITDAGGNYAFTGLPGGGYVVDVTDTGNLLEGLWHSTGSQDVASNNTSKADVYTLTVSGGQVVDTVDFGYYGDGAAVGNRVWRDDNKDGIQDVGEPGLYNATVTLRVIYPNGTTNQVVTVTDTNGYYSFGYLLLDEQFSGDGIAPEPVYSLTSSISSANFVRAKVDQGVNDWVDSDSHTGVVAVAVKGVTDVAAVAGNPSAESGGARYDFGYEWKPTLVKLVGFWAFTRDGQVWVAWETAEERETAGFYLERLVDGEYVPVHEGMIPSQFWSLGNAVYEQLDATARPGNLYVYRLVEQETGGTLRYLGPYLVLVDGAVLSFEEWSRLSFGTTPVTGTEADEAGDPDGDGMSNLAEFQAGTDPADATSALRVLSCEPGQTASVVLTWISASNRVYTVEWSTNLTQGFTGRLEGQQATPAENTCTVPVVPGADSVFYRIKVGP